MEHIYRRAAPSTLQNGSEITGTLFGIGRELCHWKGGTFLNEFYKKKRNNLGMEINR